MLEISLDKDQGVIFDMDGVIVDTTAAHYEAWQWAAAKLGVSMSEETFLDGYGRRNIEIFQEISEHDHDMNFLEKLDVEKEDKYRQYFAECSALIPGVVEVIKQLKEKGIKVAVGTSAPRENVEGVFKQYGIGNFFDTVICAEDVINGKPHPEVFRKAAESLGLESEKCIVFEDSPAGVASAVASGATVIGILSSNDQETLAKYGVKYFAEDFSKIKINFSF